MLLATEAHRLFATEIPITEKVIRTVVVYGALLFLLRLGGKRTAAQLNTFDLVVLLLISNVVQNALIGADNSLLGGLIGAAALIAANDLISRLARRNDAIDRVMEGTESRLVETGSFVHGELMRLGIRTADLEAALRRQGAENVHQVERADLFPLGPSSSTSGLRPGTPPVTTSTGSNASSRPSPPAWIASPKPAPGE
jgi:uncharacterized membrane protein YcaP (DUF421 family)